MRSTNSLPAWKHKLNFQLGIEINQEFTSQTRIKEGRQSSGDYAAYGSIRYNIVKGLDIQPAIRLIYNTRFRAPLVPSFNIKYNWDEKLVLRASYGKGYRAPSLKELYLVFFDSNHSLQGNPNLRAENGHIVNGSFNYTQTVKAHAITYGVSGFYNNINDKIDWQIIPSIGPELDTFEYINIKKYITYGGDVSIGYKWKRLQLNASAMLTNYRLSNTQSGSDRITTWSPDFTASASYKIPVAEIGITVFYKFNGRKPLFSVNNSLQTGFRDAYHMLDVSFNRNFWKDRIQLIIGGKNLVGVSNVGAQNISSIGHNFGGNAVNIGWGRTFFTSLVFRFAK
jgi:outer membrane receptor for ferrienterochelin and colicins